MALEVILGLLAFLLLFGMAGTMDYADRAANLDGMLPSEEWINGN